MVRETTEPLTPEQAKDQLRQVAARIGIVPWVRREPFGSMLTGLLAGFLFGRVPRFWSQLSRSRVGQKVIDRFV
jgi:hypothetical protein